MYCIAMFKICLSGPFSLLRLHLTTFFLFLRIKNIFLFTDWTLVCMAFKIHMLSVAKATLYYKDSDTRGDTLEIIYLYRRHTLFSSYFGIFFTPKTSNTMSTVHFVFGESSLEVRRDPFISDFRHAFIYWETLLPKPIITGHRVCKKTKLNLKNKMSFGYKM